MGTCILGTACAGMLCTNVHSENASVPKETPGRRQGIRARVLVENDANGPLPFLYVSCYRPRLGSARGSKQPLAEPSKTGSCYDFVIPYEWAAASVDPYPVFPKGEPKGVRYTYRRFVPDEALLHAELDEQPVVLGVLQCTTVDQISVNPNASGRFTATWKGSEKASIYTVSLYSRMPGPGGRAPYSILSCTRTAPAFSIDRLMMLEAIRRHAKLFKNGATYFHSAKLTLSGELVEAWCQLEIEVVGIDKANRTVYEASSGSVELKIEAPRELAILKAAEGLSGEERRNGDKDKAAPERAGEKD